MWNSLVIDRFPSRTVGPYKLAHWLRKHGYSAQVIEFAHLLSEETLFDVTTHFITPETKILGISTTFFEWEPVKHSDGVERRIPESMFNVLKRFKLEYPHIKIVLGGYQSESVPSYGIFDATVMSYTDSTEEIFVEYLEHLIYGKPAPKSEIMLQPGEKVRPFYSKASNIVYNIEKDDFVFTKQDCILPGEPLPLDISRGCIFACKFCQYQHTGKKKYDYVRGMELLEREILNNYELFGTTYYFLLDDTFNDTQQKLEEFNAMTKRLPFKISYTAYIRADLVHRFPDTAYLLKESGIFGAYCGLETLHPSASKLIGKGWSGKHAREYIPELFHNVWNKEVALHTNFIVGLTHDTLKNVFDTAQWHIDNRLHSIGFDRLGIWGPGQNNRFQIKSDFDKNPEKYGYIIDYNDNPSNPNWKTDNWTKDLAVKTMKKVSEIVAPYQKVSSWRAPTYNWLGMSREDILSKPAGYVLKNTIHDSAKLSNMLEQYIKLLLEQ